MKNRFRIGMILVLLLTTLAMQNTVTAQLKTETPEQKAKLAKLSPDAVAASELAGEPIRQKLTAAPGNGAAIGGLKVVSDGGWFAARPSGTENVYKVYAESFHGPEHLERIVAEAQTIVSAALK